MDIRVIWFTVSSASNTFKYEGYHALIIPYAHHPTAVREEQFADMVGTTIKWSASFPKIFSHIVTYLKVQNGLCKRP
eukprot:m.52377 g.52377  ORF g.52377 m.52377 type:complete len:77 (+) comp34203_c0_seq4:697-927(+)